MQHIWQKKSMSQFCLDGWRIHNLGFMAASTSKVIPGQAANKGICTKSLEHNPRPEQGPGTITLQGQYAYHWTKLVALIMLSGYCLKQCSTHRQTMHMYNNPIDWEIIQLKEHIIMFQMPKDQSEYSRYCLLYKNVNFSQ